jgi:hypothetical protein
MLVSSHSPPSLETAGAKYENLTATMSFPRERKSRLRFYKSRELYQDRIPPFEGMTRIDQFIKIAPENPVLWTGMKDASAKGRKKQTRC